MDPSASWHLVVAINPSAAFGSSRHVGPTVVRELRARGHRVTALAERDYPALRVAVERELHAEDRPDALVVVGGDGMVSLAINALGAADPGGVIALGIVPSGTGNDLARGLGIPLRDELGAIDILLTALSTGGRRVDVGVVHSGPTTVRFLGVVSAGFDARVNERANRLRWPRGRQRYNVAMLQELVLLRRIDYELVVDGVPRTVGASLISVANNTSIGGGMLITPDAVLDDGLLDLFIVQPLTRLRFLRLFPKVFSGAHTGLPVVSIERVRTVRIGAPGAAVPGVIAYADGERVGPLPVDVEVLAGAVTILV